MNPDKLAENKEGEEEEYIPAEVDEEEGEQEMLIGVKELMESVLLLMLRLNLIFTDALWDMSGCLWS